MAVGVTKGGAHYVYTEADYEALPFTALLADSLEHVPLEHTSWSAYQRVENMRPGMPMGLPASSSSSFALPSND